jgi:hypothetical protein
MGAYGCGGEAVEEDLDGVEGSEVDGAGVCARSADGEAEGRFEGCGEFCAGRYVSMG